MSKKGNSMIDPPIKRLLEKVDSRYELISIVSKRARQIIDGNESLVDEGFKKPVTIAINEVDRELLNIEKIEEEKEVIK